MPKTATKLPDNRTLLADYRRLGTLALVAQKYNANIQTVHRRLQKAPTYQALLKRNRVEAAKENILELHRNGCSGATIAGWVEKNLGFKVSRRTPLNWIRRWKEQGNGL